MLLASILVMSPPLLGISALAGGQMTITAVTPIVGIERSK
jgi:hypothetical protein